ncbi:hypothetical protein J6590_017024 [Homalodisca vitripennis]|nr:hypothetical protein J6590_017024 [Homalodisca vitripennis]
MSGVLLNQAHEQKVQEKSIDMCQKLMIAIQELSEDDFDRKVEFCELMMANVDNTTGTNNIVFSDEQDRAFPHYGANVLAHFNEIFPNHGWIGRKGKIEWPAGYPDLSPFEFFAWGHINENVYKTKAQNIEEMGEKIVQVVLSDSQESIALAVSHFYVRLGHCQTPQGEQFVHPL